MNDQRNFQWVTLGPGLNHPHGEARLSIKGKSMSITKAAMKQLPALPLVIEVDRVQKAVRFRSPRPDERPYGFNTNTSGGMRVSCLTGLPDGKYIYLDDGVFVQRDTDIIPHEAPVTKKGL